MKTTTKITLAVAVSAVLGSSVAFAAPPPKPTLNTPANGATNVAQKNVKLSWSSQGATNFRFVISQNPNFSGFRDNNSDSGCDGTCLTKTTGAATSYTKDMDLAGQTYYWKVRANNKDGASPWSDVRSFTTAGSQLSAKVDLFVTKWKGKGTDFDGSYGFQCVDLMRRYAEDVLGLSNGGKSELPAGNAYDIFANTNSSKFTKVYNSATAVPQKGDIVFWNKSSANGYAGHVAIFISGNAQSFTSIDQNWVNPSTTKGSVAAIVTHNYTSAGGVAGWLHPN